MEQKSEILLDTEEDIEIDYEKQIAEINKALEENARKVAELEKALQEMGKRKIFTLKELREMELEKKREEEERLENEKREIDTITASELERAEKLRESNEDEAFNIEMNAIRHDLEIRKMILHENENKLEDVLAELAIEENRYQRNKKAGITASKKSGDYYKLREESYKIKSRKNAYSNNCSAISEIIEKQICKIAEANRILRGISKR